MFVHRYVTGDFNGTHPVYRFGAVLLELPRTKFHITVYSTVPPPKQGEPHKDLSGVVDRCACTFVRVRACRADEVRVRVEDGW